MTVQILIRKHITATETKVIDEAQGIVRAYVNTMEAVDFDGEVIASGTFDRAVERSGKLPKVVDSHEWAQRLGKVIATGQDGNRQWADIQFNLETQRGREAFSDVRFGAVDEYSVGFYVLPDGEGTANYNGRPRRYIKEIDWVEVSPVMRGASPDTGTVWAKQRDAEAKDTWTTVYQNNLPDSAFALIEGGGKKDESGKTVPRSLRHFPHHDAAGKVDEAHVRNALGRIPQSTVSDADKAKALAHIKRHAAALGIGEQALRGIEHQARAAWYAKWLSMDEPPEGSYEDLIKDLREALSERLGGPLGPGVFPMENAPDLVWVIATFPDYCIALVRADDEPTYWRVPYTLDADGEPVVGTPVQVAIPPGDPFVPVAGDSGGMGDDGYMIYTAHGATPAPTAPATSPEDEAAGTDWRMVDARMRLTALRMGMLGVAVPAAKVGRRNSGADQALVQTIHDAAVALGATCDMGDGTG